VKGPVVIRVIERAEDFVEGTGRYLQAYDVEAYGGRGFVALTTDIREAMVFATEGDAHIAWRSQSYRYPLRGDGKPNRPLTAYNVTFDPAP
jgi:hypothetical protein